MITRLVPIALALFWVVMNVFLWRSEYGSVGGIFPWNRGLEADRVLDRILSAPDASPMVLFQRGIRLGTVRFSPTVRAQENISSTNSLESSQLVEGRVEGIAGYTLDLDANVSLPEQPGRWRVNATMLMTTNRQFESMDLTLQQRQFLWKIQSKAADRTIEIQAELGGKPFKYTLNWSDLSQPSRLLALATLASGVDLSDAASSRRRGGAQDSASLHSWLALANTNSPAAGTAPSWRWTAEPAELRFGTGNQRLRVERMKIRVMERMEISLWVNRAGEILKVEFPGSFHLINDSLLNQDSKTPSYDRAH